MREDSCSMSLLEIPWLGMTSCCCCCFCGPLPNSPHSLMWDQLHIQLDNNCNFQSQEIGIRRGSCSDSWLYLSFCLLIDALFILGTFQTLAEKFLVSPEGTTLSNRISPGSRAARFEKRNAHTLAGIFALYNFSLWYPEDTHQTSQEFLFFKKMNFCQCFTLRNTLRAACSQNKHCLCLRRELILGTRALFRECHTLWVLCYTVWTPHL